MGSKCGRLPRRAPSSVCTPPRVCASRCARSPWPTPLAQHPLKHSAQPRARALLGARQRARAAFCGPSAQPPPTATLRSSACVGSKRRTQASMRSSVAPLLRGCALPECAHSPGTCASGSCPPGGAALQNAWTCPRCQNAWLPPVAACALCTETLRPGQAKYEDCASRSGR